MSRDPTQRLQDIIEACDRLAGYLDGYDWERFQADPRTQDAVARVCEIIGDEAQSAKMVSAIGNSAGPEKTEGWVEAGAHWAT